jgi:ribose 5-phosphate isomerase B
VAFQVIGIASDHAGFELKAELTALLKEKGWQVRDFGTHSAESCDYPDTIVQCAQALARGELGRALVICGSGIGASICANKVPGVRAALCLEPSQAEFCRRHNRADCLVLAARERSLEENRRLLEIWLEAPFDGGRHQNRIEKIHRLTQC